MYLSHLAIFKTAFLRDTKFLNWPFVYRRSPSLVLSWLSPLCYHFSSSIFILARCTVAFPFTLSLSRSSRILSLSYILSLFAVWISFFLSSGKFHAYHFYLRLINVRLSFSTSYCQIIPLFFLESLLSLRDYFSVFVLPSVLIEVRFFTAHDFSYFRVYSNLKLCFIVLNFHEKIIRTILYLRYKIGHIFYLVYLENFVETMFKLWYNLTFIFVTFIKKI